MDSLYKDLLLDHISHPRHRGSLEHPDLTEHGVNPTCGDDVTWMICFSNEEGDHDRITDIAWEGKGCVISQASISILAEMLIGKSRQDIASMTTQDLFMLIGGEIIETRHRCALLGLVTLQRALRDSHETTLKGQS